MINPLCTSGSFWFGMVRCINPEVTGDKPNKIVFLSLKIAFIMANSAVQDEMLHHAAFHLGLCLPKYAFRSHQYAKGLQGYNI